MIRNCQKKVLKANIGLKSKFAKFYKQRMHNKQAQICAKGCEGLHPTIFSLVLHDQISLKDRIVMVDISGFNTNFGKFQIG